uniref:Type II secretion system protein M n=1 Tax=Desulfatirhabdium butyrativorans TaxID=340467 RepID=A0A7C4RQW8_9BACT
MGFLRLSIREKRVITLLAILLSGLLLYEGIWVPVSAWRQRLHMAVSVKKRQALELAALVDASNGLQERLQAIRKQIEERPVDFDLFSFLRRIADSLEMGTHITAMKPLQTETVGPYRLVRMEVKWKDIEWVPLLQWMAQVEGSGHSVRVQKLVIIPSPENPTMLEASIQVQTLER